MPGTARNTPESHAPPGHPQRSGTRGGRVIGALGGVVLHGPWAALGLLAAGLIVTAVAAARLKATDYGSAWLALVGGTITSLFMSWLVLWRQQRVRFYKERAETTEALRASEVRYRRLFESARDGILILDAETGRIADVNPFLTQLLGVTREDFLNHHLWELGFFKDIAANEAKFAELQTKKYVRYEDLPLEAADGRQIEVEFVSNVYLVDEVRVIQCNIRDITERKRTERMAQDALTTLNRPNNTRNIIRDLLEIIKKRTGIEAVGIRLKEGEDFTYYQTNGFPDSFVETESHLCARDAAGQMLRDSQGRPVLECLCGDILCGRTDAAQPCFTEAGSFWSNCMTDFSSTTTKTERQAHIRDRCNIESYESVALIPLRAGEETIGLLQLNDHRHDQFTLELITTLEWLGASVGVALTRMREEDHVREQLEELEHWHEVTLGREGRVLELKQEVNALLAEAGQSPKYSDADLEDES